MPSLDEIPDGVSVFVDSTILHYAFVRFEPATAQCIRFLSRVSKSQLKASITLPVLNDAVHKVMCSEAVARFGRPRAGLVSWLKQSPEEVRSLTRASTLFDLVSALPLQVIIAGVGSLAQAQQKVAQYGLLASDALIASMMESHAIEHLATNDDDFDRVPNISVWKPR